MASLESLEKLIIDFKESLEREMHEGFAAVNARLDYTNARLDRIGGLVNGGGRAIAKMIEWSEKADISMAELLRRQDDMEKRLRKLEGGQNGKA